MSQIAQILGIGGPDIGACVGGYECKMCVDDICSAVGGEECAYPRGIIGRKGDHAAAPKEPPKLGLAW